MVMLDRYCSISAVLGSCLSIPISLRNFKQKWENKSHHGLKVAEEGHCGLRRGYHGAISNTEVRREDYGGNKALT